MIGIVFVGIALFVFCLYARSFFWREFIPYEPRRPVKWTGPELFAFFVAWILIIAVSVDVCRSWEFSSLIKERALEPEQVHQLQKEHEIAQLVVAGRDDPLVFFVVFLAGVILIPIGEEFLFRLLLQGYAEKQEGRLRRLLGFFAARGFFSVFGCATIFAAIHWRSTTEERSIQNLFDGLLGMMIGYLIVLTLITVYLLCVRGATARDLGVNWQKIPGDCLLGLGTAVFLFPPIYCLNYGLITWVGETDLDFTLDPIPLFFFAVGAGVLYFRTHRLLPVIVLHALFNGIGVASAYISAYVLF